ncbi:hypothetical protein NBRC116600_34900 [Thalassotalea sp. SU-HH00458]
MILFGDLNKALYFRFKLIMIFIEGESEITHVSSVLLLSLFQLCLIFLIMLFLNYFNIPFVTFSGGIEGKIIAVTFILMLVVANLITLKVRDFHGDSIFIKEKKPTLATDIFILLVIILIVFFSYIN